MSEDPDDAPVGEAPPRGRGRCANCGERLTGPFCSTCGQENRNLARIPLRQLLQEWLGDAFTFDSRVFRTLVPLVRRPGLLTREYLAGRRVRYVPPLRLFVFSSLVMFLGLAVVGPQFSWKLTDSEGEEIVAYDPREGHSTGPGGRPTEPQGDPTEPSPTGSPAPAPADEPDDLPEIFDRPEELSRRILDLSPQAMLVLVPVFAFFVWVLHRRRERLYVPHLIFSLHLHSFVFLLVLVSCIIDLPFPPLKRPGNFLLFLVPPYLYFAQRRVYGGGRLANLLRAALLVLLHFFAWLALMMGVLWLVVLLA